MGNIRLQGHEKFALRDGWLSKALKLINMDKYMEYSDLFLRKDAPDIFGMGNNMVKSLRYWLKALGISEEKSGAGVRLSPTGQIIKDYDPYIEDVFTIWVLHSNIAMNFQEATTWYLFFNEFDIIDFKKNQLFDSFKRQLLNYVEKFPEKSLRSDIDVLLNMYSKDKEMTDPEEKNQSPFTQLGLVKYVDGEYTKMHPDKRIINEWNVLFELMKGHKSGDSLSINNLIEGKESIASIYQLTATFVNELLDKLDSRNLIKVNRTAGLDVIYIETDMKSEDVLEEYYRNHR